MLKRIAAHPVGAGLILLGLGSTTLLAFFTQFFAWLWGRITALYEWLVASSELPNWGIVLLCALVVPSLVRLVTYLLNKNPPEPTVYDYQEDTFFNIKWRWSYSGNSMVGLCSFCPYCDYQIYGSNSQELTGSGFKTHSKFHCDGCNSHLQSLNISCAEVGERAILRAQQIIRTDKWKERIQTPSKSC